MPIQALLRHEWVGLGTRDGPQRLPGRSHSRLAPLQAPPSRIPPTMTVLSVIAQPNSQLSLLLIPALLLSMWGLFSAGVSWIGGWSALSRIYRTQIQFVGAKWMMQSAQMRWWMNYNNILTLGVNPQGLYLAVLFLFRFRHPPLLIPWSDIKVRRSSGWIFEYAILTLGHEIEIPLKISKSLAEKLRAAAGASWRWKRPDLPVHTRTSDGVAHSSPLMA